VRHLSQSQIRTYLYCGEYFRRERIEGEFLGLKTVSMARGSGVHRGAEHNFTQKKETHADLPKSEIVGAAVQGYEEQLEADGFGLWMPPEEKARGKATVVGEEKDRTVRLAKLFTEKVAPPIQPTMVEAQGTVVVKEDVLEFVGFLDVIEGKKIHDLKTATKKDSPATIHTDFQVTSYATIFKAVTGEWPDVFQKEILVDTKTPNVQILQTQRDEADAQAWLNMVVAVHNQIEAGIFPPATLGFWKCAPKWCAAWPTCRYVSRSADRRLAAL
jgi:hypothetical protein